MAGKGGRVMAVVMQGADVGNALAAEGGARVGQTSTPPSPHPGAGRENLGVGWRGISPLKGGDIIPPAPPYPCGSDFGAAKAGVGQTPTPPSPNPRKARPPCPPPPEPSPFRILVDTREQTPLPFARLVPTRRATLYPGDYTVEGLETLFAVERKSLADLVGTLVGHADLADGTRRNSRDRLVEELMAMSGFKFKCVAVTSPRAAIEEHRYQSRIDPRNVVGMIASIEAWTGVPFKFFADADEAARWIAVEALHFWRQAHGLSTLRPKLRVGRLAPRTRTGLDGEDKGR